MTSGGRREGFRMELEARRIRLLVDESELAEVSKEMSE